MLLTTRALLLGAASLLCGLAHSYDLGFQGNRCNRDMMNSDPFFIGGGDGTDFCETLADIGVVITGIEVWAEGNGVNGLKFYFSDGWVSPQVGRQLGEAKRFDWKPDNGDLISSIELWGDGSGHHMGRIKLGLNNGQTFEHGRNPYVLNAGGGIMLGAAGLHELGTGINQLTFRMLKSKIHSMELGSLQYKESLEDLNNKKAGITDRLLQEVHFINDQENNNTMDYNFEERWATSAKKTWALTQTHSVGVTIANKVTAEIATFKVEHSVELSYEYSNAAMQGGEAGQEDIRVFGAKGTLDYGEEAWCQSVAQRGAFEGAFTTVVKLNLEDGTTWQFDSEGESGVIKYSEASTKCQSKPFSNTIERAPGDEVKLVEKKGEKKKRGERKFVA
ncbi:hypothetical protein BDV95DRAFT_608997 [Massariosphaeria phaeospora]|uniref:Jacalin-type lectin domain-containing protein n=1 Tax=Massariosphaeria phaeospora TaxID=100035 RepID=A0A7C8I6J8_9PLEO|nr:hypothetical protein BDV95DRAFT_608997 [Massariosphaeria phaeospora]